jgi:hypothetical protein
MKHISPYITEARAIEFSTVINESLSPFGSLLDHSLSIESIKSECGILNRIESMVSEEMQTQFHLNMILEESRKKISKYNRELVKGKNLLISEASNLLSTVDRLVEELKTARKNNPIFEQAVSEIPTGSDAISSEFGADFNDVLSNISSVDDIPSDLSNKEGSLMGILKMLWNGLTEGGSPIGIFQFILDIVGLVGDFFGPVGLIADVINGIIYLIRGKYMLALISFIAAMIPFGGNVLKGWLQTSKIAKPVMDIGGIYLKEGGKIGAKVSDDAAKIAAAAAPDSIKALEYISKTGKKAMTGLSGFITKFFDNFLAKLVGWIPFIGKPLKRFFNGISDTIASFSSKVGKMSDDIPKVINKAELENMNKFFKAASKEGSELTVKGTDLIVTSASGKVTKIPAKFLKGTDFMLQRYGKGVGKKMQKLLKSTEMNSLDFYKSLSNGLKSMDSTYGKGAKIAGASFSFSKKVPLFIGKEVYKFISDAGEHLNLSDGEYEMWGNAAIYDLMKDRTEKALEENPNAIIDVPYVDNLEDNEAVDIMRQTQNDYAEAFNLPSIGTVGYYTRGEKDKTPPEVVEFYEDLYEGDTEALDQMSNMFSIPESVQRTRLTHIKSYSSFLNQ